MRVLHILPYVTADARYGGPVTVAFNLAREISRRGHDCQIAAPASGLPSGQVSFLDVHAHLFSAHHVAPRFFGYSSVVTPRLNHWLWRHARDYDVVHVHVSRDLTTLPAARLLPSAVPLVLQTHGMIRASHNRMAPLVDWGFTKPALRRADVVLTLNEAESRDIASLEPLARASVLRNGLPDPADVAITHPTQPPEVLYLARLHPRKQPDVFVDAAKLCLRVGTRARFALVGPDQGMARKLAEQIGDDSPNIQIEGPITPNRVSDRMARATIYVLPSKDEPFGMTILEAMAVGTPVIVTRGGELSPIVERAGAGVVVEDGPTFLSAAIRALLDNPQRRRQMSSSGKDYVRRHFHISTVVDELFEHYERARSERAS